MLTRYRHLVLPAAVWAALAAVAIALWVAGDVDPFVIMVVAWCGGVAFSWVVVRAGFTGPGHAPAGRREERGPSPS